MQNIDFMNISDHEMKGWERHQLDHFKVYLGMIQTETSLHPQLPLCYPISSRAKWNTERKCDLIQIFMLTQ